MALTVTDAIAGTVCPKCGGLKLAGFAYHSCKDGKDWYAGEIVDHPQHYGGAEDPFEHIKVAEAKGWGYHIGNCTKYLWRLGKKSANILEDAKKAKWYLDRYIQLLETSEVEDTLSVRLAKGYACWICHKNILTGELVKNGPTGYTWHRECDTKATMMQEKK